MLYGDGKWRQDGSLYRHDALVSNPNAMLLLYQLEALFYSYLQPVTLDI